MNLEEVGFLTCPTGGALVALTSYHYIILCFMQTMSQATSVICTVIQVLNQLTGRCEFLIFWSVFDCRGTKEHVKISPERVLHMNALLMNLTSGLTLRHPHIWLLLMTVCINLFLLCDTLFLPVCLNFVYSVHYYCYYEICITGLSLLAISCLIRGVYMTYGSYWPGKNSGGCL